MKIIESAITFIVNLDKRRFMIYFVTLLFTIFLITGGITYVIHVKGTNLVAHIRNFQKITRDAREITYLYETIQDRKQGIIDALEQEQDFELKSFFASFCKENNIKPESNWSTIATSIEGNEFLEEISLAAIFNNFTMQKCVALFEALEKKDIVYIKNMTISKEGEDKKTSKTVSLDLAIATLKYRQKEGG